MSVFIYKRHVHFYETDLMGIVHHANYLRYFEEARVAWLRDRKISAYHSADPGNCLFAVYSTEVKHLKPCFFEDHLDIELQAKLEGIRIIYEYKMLSSRFDLPVATAKTVHVPVDGSMKIIKLPKPIREVLEKEPWTEIWL